MASAEYPDPRSEFATAIKAAGLVLDEAPVMDGQLHRVPVDGAKNGKRDGSYVGFLDGKPSGYIENFKTGHKENWTAANLVQTTAQERADAAAQMHLARRRRAVETAAQHRQTAEKVLLKWEGLADVPPTGQNPYLARKGVQAHGVKFDGERLVVPVRDIDGKLWSVQSIAPEEGAAKMFEKGGRKAGNMHVIGELKPGVEVLVAEGYATGASLHQATGKTVAVAFDAGNLDPVVAAIKVRYPTSPVYIMGDDDRQQQPNVGFDKATAAAQKHQVAVVFPQFQEAGNLSDFNDLHLREGLNAVRAQVDRATSQAMAKSQEHSSTLAPGISPPAVLEKGAPLAVTDTVVTLTPAHLRSTATAETTAIETKTGAPHRYPGELTARGAMIGATHAAQPAQVDGPVVHTVVQAAGVADVAKIVLDVAQGSEVRALDAASATASVTMSAGLAGSAMQLGGHAVTGIGALDSAERALNALKAKLKEPDPVDVEERKAIERRNDEMLAVPRNGLDEGTAREIVKLDIASLHQIDNLRERQAAAAAMGHNAQNQNEYKTELARQDRDTAEVVALAYAREQQEIFAKEQRAADIAANPAKATVNSIEHVSSREPRAEPAAARRIEPPLEDRFNIVTRFSGRDYHFRDQPGKVAFKERWLSMTSTVDTPPVVKAMLDRAQERGWKEIRVKGSEEFQRQAWIAATARGIKAVGYDPTDADRVAAKEERARLGKDRGEPSAQSKGPISREQQPAAAQDKRTARGGPQRSSIRADLPEHGVDAARAQAGELSPACPSAAAEMPIAKPLRDFLTARGDAPKDVEATVALASEQMGRDRVHVGHVLAHGRDHFEFDKNNEQNYYVRLQSPAGEKVVWGADLRRALEESQSEVGDSVALEHRGMQLVTVVVKDRDASGKVTGEHEVQAKRNTWYAANIEQWRREAVLEASAKDQRSTSPDMGLERTSTAPAPAATRNEQPNSRDAVIFQALEVAFDTKNVPEELRADIRAQVRKELDVRMAVGEPAKVAIYDPAAPSREPQRTVQMPQRQNKEHERSR